MTRATRNGLALGGLVAALIVLFVAGNLRLFADAFGARSDCVVVEGAARPAKPAC